MKRKTRSSTLSHLLSQGRISAESLKADRDLRRAVAPKVLAETGITLDAALFEPFVARDWEVVYAIIAPNAGKLPAALSFFSKLNLVHASDIVRGALDFRLSVLGIQEQP